MAHAFRTGQRWISISEPELGLGEVRMVGARAVTLWFAAVSESRQYVASDDVPLRRAAFRVGDTVALARGGSLTIERIAEHEGLLLYSGTAGEVSERELSATLTFNSPLERLSAGQFDSASLFSLRHEALVHQHRRRKSPVRGFVGARIDLLPHQLGIAAEVTSRLLPRVLLADEVGLGKTIEACLILHRLLTTGRAARVLVIVPETLTHQWFLELLRRFNLWFHIFTEARCVGIEETDPGVNPFLDDQLVLCELTLFTGNSARLEQAVEAGWDLVVVDEAHHLRWSPEEASPEYLVVERLALTSPGVLLLTATPEQLGRAGHFARLRLLDPNRFHDLTQFEVEADRYRHIARLASALHEGAELPAHDRQLLASLLDEPAAAATSLASLDHAVRHRWLELLTDQHGTGRVMFRNTRASVGGFPARVAHLDVLDGSASTARSLTQEWNEDAECAAPQSRVSLASDARVDWVLGIIKTWEPDKILVICRSPRRALALETALSQRTTLPLTAFHEEMTLLQRDRSAAWFADPNGARVLICSEIGSEGRNFQFAHHLVLFDVPLDPGLLEQRIGRLDRIGQRSTIHVHVPVVPGTHLEVLARWYHDGLNAFERHVPGARQLLDRFEPRLRQLATPARRSGRQTPSSLDTFIEEVRTARQEVAARLEAGRDRLLEWNSLRREQASRVIDDITRLDSDESLDAFMLSVFDAFFIEVEELSPRTYRLGSAGVLLDVFPGLRSDTVTVTCSRDLALRREDVQFLTWDHPLAGGALDVLLSSEKGNCSFARWLDAGKPALYLEAVFVVEAIAPSALHIDRFLPPTPVRIVVDHAGRDAGAVLSDGHPGLQGAPSGPALLARADVRERIVPRMVESAQALAEAAVPAIVEGAQKAMRTTLDEEIARLTHLKQRNPFVRDEEIAALRQQRDDLETHLRQSRLRLDAVQLIHRGPDRDVAAQRGQHDAARGAQR